MLTPAFIDISTFFYPIGNTPAVSLTQTIPPTETADVLLLGCGDVRNILFTTHLDNRKLDITCCDNQKAIIARNVLLLSLVIDGEDGQNDKLWDIYYHMYTDQSAFDLIRSQAKKLYDLSATIDMWEQSKYGPHLRFCDSVALSSARKMWHFYSAESEGVDFDVCLGSAIGRARAMRGNSHQLNVTTYRSAMPAQSHLSEDIDVLCQHYWKYGTSHVKVDARVAAKYPNPTFLTGENGATVHHGSHPLAGFHLATAFLTIRSDNRGLDRLHRLERPGAVARMEFREWIASYRNHLSDVKIRFFIGDAVAFCHTLQNKRVTTAMTAHWYQGRCGLKPLVLDGYDYASGAAPLDFDVIDTSNLCDYIGSLTLLTAASPLLRNRASSALFTEVLAKNHGTPREVLDMIVCGHVPSLSTLLGLFPVEYWTNTSSVSFIDESFLIRKDNSGKQMYIRTCWKRSLCSVLSLSSHSIVTKIRFDASQLANVLYQVYFRMFQRSDPRQFSFVWYHRASFASFLRLVQTRVLCDWDVAMKRLLALIAERHSDPVSRIYTEELVLYLHVMGIYSSEIPEPWNDRRGTKPTWNGGLSLHASRVSPIGEKRGNLRDWGNIPAVVSVTLRIPREKLAVFTDIGQNELRTLFVHCVLQSADSGTAPSQNMFLACQLAFGDISTRGEPYHDTFEVSVMEDDAGWHGSSPLIAVFYAPASLLLQPQATVVIGVHSTGTTTSNLGPRILMDMKIHETTVGNSATVYITRYAPNQTGLPVAPGFAQTAVAGLPITGANVSLIAGVNGQTGHITKFTGRMDLTCSHYKQALRDRCGVHRSTVSPSEVMICLGETPPLPLSFPVVIGEAKQKLKISRKSSWVELIVQVADGSGWVKYPEYMYPVHLQDGKPTNWNMPYLQLLKCPLITTDLASSMVLIPHVFCALSLREAELSTQRILYPPRHAGEQARTDFKCSIGFMFMNFARFHKGRRYMMSLYNPANCRDYLLILASSLRLNLADRAAVLDCAVLPLRETMAADIKAYIESESSIIRIEVNDAELQIWGHVLPAYVERCRTWAHGTDCEYAAAGKIPLDAVLCTCGNGKFAADFDTNLPNWDMLQKHAIRAAISPPFWAPFVSDAYRGQF
ncbi:hypothetical protein F4802DRAFT_616112 [Xylaria palmicola]|nr:hypothetical protein F4802DRAFT_616112 [Xylaria palmicola]